MNLRRLKRFITVAEFGSINKAAAQLNVSQPSLSKDIQDLEEELGLPLFLRTGRGVALSTFGHTMFQRAKLVDAEFRKLEDEARALRDVSLGEVSVGVVPGFLQSRVLPTATLNLTKRAKRLTVNYRFGTRASLLKPLLQGDLDFVIVGIEEEELADELISEPLVADRNAVVVAANHPILQSSQALDKNLAQYPWLVLSECIFLEQMLRQILRADGAPFSNSIIRTDSFHFFRSTLMASDFIGLTRFDATRLEKEAGNVIELELDDEKFPNLMGRHMIGIVCRRDTQPSPASQALIKEIRSLTASSENAPTAAPAASTRPARTLP